MIDLEASASALNEHVVVPAPPVATVLVRARRIRTRRRLAALTAIGTATCVVVGVVALWRSDARVEPRIIIGHDTPTSTTFARPTTVAPPKEYVTRSADVTPNGGLARINVVDTATGHSGLRFAADGSGRIGLSHRLGLVFWMQVNDAGPAIEVMETSITGGDPHMIASYRGGTYGPDGPEWPLFEGVSPDGTRLWMHGDTIRNLVDLHEDTIALPPSPSPRLGAGTSWLADGHRLFVVEYTDAPDPCATTDDVILPGADRPDCARRGATGRKRGFVFDLRDPSAGWQETPQAAIDTGWSGLQLLGPGRLPATVVAVAQPKAVSAPARPHVLTVDVGTGRIVDDVAIPGDAVLAVDGSGTNILFRNGRHLERLSLADTRPIVIGPAVQDAAW